MVSNRTDKVQYRKRKAALLSATITAVLLFSTMVSGLFAGMGLDVVPFAQAQQINKKRYSYRLQRTRSILSY
jgi:lipid-binding SYLF domain-containing protein